MIYYQIKLPPGLCQHCKNKDTENEPGCKRWVWYPKNHKIAFNPKTKKNEPEKRIKAIPGVTAGEKHWKSVYGPDAQPDYGLDTTVVECSGYEQEEDKT